MNITSLRKIQLVSRLLIISICFTLFWRMGLHATFESKVVLPESILSIAKAWKTARLGSSPYSINNNPPFFHSPSTLALFQFFPREPKLSWILLNALSAISLGVSLYLGMQMKSLSMLGALIMGLVLAWKGILETFENGQIEIIVLAAIIFSAFFMVRTPILSGFILGTLVWLKLQWVWLIFPFALLLFESDRSLRKRLSKFLSGYLFGVILWGCAVPSIVFGPDRALQLSQQWVTFLKTYSQNSFQSSANQSAWVAMFRWFDPLHPTLLYGIILMAFGLIAGRLQSRPELAIFRFWGVSAWIGPWILLLNLLNPLSTKGGSVFAALIPPAILARPKLIIRSPLDDADRKSRITLWCLLLLLWLLQQNPFVQMIGFSNWHELQAVGTITMYWIVLLLLCL